MLSLELLSDMTCLRFLALGSLLLSEITSLLSVSSPVSTISSTELSSTPLITLSDSELNSCCSNSERQLSLPESEDSTKGIELSPVKKLTTSSQVYFLAIVIQ